MSTGPWQLPARLRPDDPSGCLAVDPREVGVEARPPMGEDEGVLARASLDEASRTRWVVREWSRDPIAEVHIRAPRPRALACYWADGLPTSGTPMTRVRANPLQAQTGHAPAHVASKAGGVTRKR